MRFRSSWVASALLALATPVLLAQGNPTGTLSGNVTHDGQPLPGVTVSVTSPNLQGTRSTVTGLNGDYLLPLLPSGDYKVKFSMSGFDAVTQDVKVSIAQTARVDAAMKMGVATAVEVHGARETISPALTAATTITSEVMDKLPIARTFAAAATLAPGVNNSGPGANERTGAASIVISGSQSYENLFLVNGVVVNENVRGQGLNLFIEDAIQETTATTSSVSAEYGRFAGGVVNVITKSGGNRFSGSFRTSITNDSWSALTNYRNASGAVAENLQDKNNPTYEATLGGPILKDRLWFFGAGRFQKFSVNATTRAPVSATYVTGLDQKRYEGKLTFSLTSQHQLLGTYQKIDQDDLGNTFPPIYDLASVYDRQTPQELYAGNYTGTLTPNTFVEAQYSKRKFTFKNSGSRFTDLINGTLMVDNSNGARFWSPTFCGVCDDEKRDNENITIKGSYFLSTKGLGSHTLVAGYDRFRDIRFSNNHQSGSDYRIYTQGVLVRDGVVFPVIGTAATGTSPSFIRWTPILEGTQGTNFITNSVYLNDQWRLSSRLTANIGVRYDKNAGGNSVGVETTNDSKFSPRLGLSYDVKGDGDIVLSAFYGRYVAAIANNIADSSSLGGQPALVDYDYRGPAINSDPNAPTSSLVGTAAAIQQVFDWFNANGGTGRTTRGNPSIPGLNPNITSSLNSPNTNEVNGSISKRFGSRGIVRVDGVYRRSEDFYATQTDLTTGTVSGTLAGVTRTFDKQLVVNTNLAQRKYTALNVNFSTRPLDRLRVEGNWTWSHTLGNFDGETGPNGPVTFTVLNYPEYQQERWSAPNGDVATDRRHKVRGWVIYDVPKMVNWMDISASVLHSFDTGAPYGAVGTVDTRPYVTGLAYKTPPATVTYWFTGRDTFRTDPINRTDVSLNLGFKPYKDFELFLSPEVINIFNLQGIANISGVDQTVQTRANTGSAAFAAFNPFTTAPRQGAAATGGATPVNNWNYGPSFGKATGPAAFQQPRTFRISAGIRF